MELTAIRKEWPLRTPFQIAYETTACLETVLVEIRDGSDRGRSEAAGVSYHGETALTMLAEIEAVRSAIEAGATRAQLGALLPAGGARNAIDCALWDLRAKQTRIPAWKLAGCYAPKSCETFFTLGLDSPQGMAQAARNVRSRGFAKLKLKLDGSVDEARVSAVRVAVPDATIIVDANGSWSERQLADFAVRFGELGVELIEQPLPWTADEALREFDSPIPICADESCQTSMSLPELSGKYDAVCIKLDKTGGLTEALDLARLARQHGFLLMIGNMCGSSLAMAPAFLLAQHATFVDLDGPLLNVTDWDDGIRYVGAEMTPPERSLWG